MSDLNRLLQKQNAKTANGPSVSTIVNQAANPAEARFTITGNATGGDVLAITVDSIDLNYTTVAAETPAVAAAAAASAWQTAMDGAYSIGEYTVADDGDDVVITKTNGTELWVESTLPRASVHQALCVRMAMMMPKPAISVSADVPP